MKRVQNFFGHKSLLFKPQVLWPVGGDAFRVMSRRARAPGHSQMELLKVARSSSAKAPVSAQ